MAISVETIYQRIEGVFREVFDDHDITPHEKMTAADVPAWDSLSNIRFVVAVEEEFGIQFAAGEIAGLANVGEFVRAIEQKATK